MNTPCQADPESWVSDDPTERSYAAKACGECHVRTACLNEAVASGITFGVWGGRDFTKSKRKPPRMPTPTHCGWCGTSITQRSGGGPKRQYCSTVCTSKAYYRRTKAAAS